MAKHVDYAAQYPLLRLVERELGRAHHRFLRGRNPRDLEHADLLLAGSLRFGIESAAAVRMLLRESYVIQALAVARSMFELAIRVEWAAGEPGGWDLLIGYYVTVELNAAKARERDRGPDERRARVLDDADAHRRANMASHKWGLIKNSASVLGAVVDRRREQGSEIPAGAGRQLYTLIYTLFLHQAAHGSPSIFLRLYDQHPPPPIPVDMAVATAADSILRALCLHEGWPEIQVRGDLALAVVRRSEATEREDSAPSKGEGQ